MSSVRNPVWVELIQLLPVVSLAFPFILAGEIDVAHAGGALLVAALLTIPVTAVVVWRKGVLNPILVGTGLWLWVSALAFAGLLPGLVAPLSEAQACGLFVGVLVAGVVSTLFSAQGFVGCRNDDRRWVLRASLGLLALAAVAVGWSWWFRHDVRVGGGLPFIVLNVMRRVLVLRAPGPTQGPGR